MAYTSRDEIDERYTWDLSSLCADDTDFETRLAALATKPAELLTFKGKVATDAKALLAFLQLEDEVDVELTKLFNYAERKADEDTRVAKYQAYSAQAMQLYTQIIEATSWFKGEILSVSHDELEALIAAEAGLAGYRRALEQIERFRAHTLSEKEEALLAAAEDAAAQPGRIFSLFNDADLTFEAALDSKGEAHPVSHGAYAPLLMSEDETLRKNAFESTYKRYKEFENTAAAMLTAQQKQLRFFAKARKYETALAAAVHENEVPEQVYHNLIAAVHENFSPYYKYVELRKKALAKEKLNFWDMYVPLVQDLEMNFSFEEACELMLKALAPLGEDYLALVRKALNERWIDVYETPGKRSGAYSAGSYGTNPIILLNYQGKLDDVFTLVHEMGHSIHTYLSTHNQDPAYSDYVIFVAEVASTTNEALLSHYLLEHEKDPARHAYILNHFVEQFKSTLYRQCMFAEFEWEAEKLLAEAGGLTAESLNEIYKGLLELYFGPEVEVDELICREWARIPHFYYNYYVYQYATGFAAAIALSNRILAEGESAVNDYLNFLKGGSSKDPISLLKGAGVDMSSPKPVHAALSYFDSLVDQLSVELAD